MSTIKRATLTAVETEYDDKFYPRTGIEDPDQATVHTEGTRAVFILT